MSLKDLAIEYTQDPFIRALVHLTNAMSRSANEIYGRRHESLLEMWKVAGSIAEDLRNREAWVKQSLGLGVDSGIQTGSLGARHTIFTTMYYNILLLTFRPFLVFRGHWQRDRKRERHQSGGAGSSPPIEAPSWLNEACNYTLTAAQKTILHLYEASSVNDHVRQLRYHGYFIASACFTLIYDMVHDGHAASVHLPLIYASLQTLTTMRAGDPVTSTITAIQTALRKINPSYEWSPSSKPDSNPGIRHSSVIQPLPTTAASAAATTTDTQQHTQQPGTVPHDPPLQSLEGARPDLSGFQPILPSMDMPGLAGSNEDLFDFTKAGMGWDFDFSTMDLDTFFSIDQSLDSTAI